MQSLFLSSEEDVTKFSSSFVWIRGMWHTENAFNKIIHFHPFCPHFSWICVRLQCHLFLFFSSLFSIAITNEQVQRTEEKTRPAAKCEADLNCGCCRWFCPLGTWHPLRLSVALWMCLFCNAYPPRRCSCTDFSKRYHCNWLNIWCVYLALTWRHSCKRC